MADQELKIQIITEADNSGFKSASSAADELTGATKNAAEKTKDLGAAETKGSTTAELLERNHRSLHKILHLIAREAGPEAGAALAGLGAISGGGISLGIMAATELVAVLKESAEAASKVKEAARDAFVDLTKEAASATEEIIKSKKAIDDFWDSLNRKSAQAAVKAAFEGQLQQIKDIAKAAEDAGLAGKGDAKEFERHSTDIAMSKRAQSNDATVAALSEQLERLKGKTTGDDAKKQLEELSALQRDKDKLSEAFSKGSGYRTSSAIGPNVLVDNTLGDDKNEAVRKTQFENINRLLEEEILRRQQTNQKLQDHIKLLEDIITSKTEESATLKASVQKQRGETATGDFAKAKSLADNFSSGRGISSSEANYIVLLEQAITGQRQTLNSAVALIQAQSQNINTAATVLEQHRNQIAVVHQRLDQLARQTGSISAITR
jgi:hypothetical protein